jgi:GH24 family phage-related lysozyme (muramidase)
MADTNQISAEMEAILRQAQEDLKNFGFVTQDTSERLKGAEAQAKKFEMAMGLGGKAVTSLAKAGMEAASAMYEGKKGAAAFNSSVDSMAEAAMAAGAVLTLMIPGGPVVKALIAGLTLAVGALAKYTKAANEMSDTLYTSFQKMSKSGAAASDGMSGIYDGMQKLGLGIQDLDGYVTLLNENSQDLALFGGAVFEGRKRFEDMGAAMKPFREQLYNAGLSQEAINKGAMGYLKLQTQLGRSQTMSTQQLADGAKKYLIEQDALTKLTGQSREEMEKQAEAALMEEQYAAKIRELELAGNKDAVEALRKMNAVYSQAGPEMGRAFRASVTGNLSNADAQKANLSSNGEMLRTTQAVIDGQLNFKDAINTTGKAMGNTADTVGTTLGQFNAYNDTFGNFSEQQKLRMITEKDLNSTLAKIEKDQTTQGVNGGKAADAAQQAQTDLRLAQIDAMHATQDLVFDGIVPATKAMILLAEGTAAAAKALRGIPGAADKEERTKDAYANSETVGAAGEIGQVMAEGQIAIGKQPEPEKVKSVNEMSWFDKMLVGKENVKKREAAEAAGQTPAQAAGVGTKSATAPAPSAPPGGGAVSTPPGSGGSAAPPAAPPGPAATPQGPVSAGGGGRGESPGKLPTPESKGKGGSLNDAFAMDMIKRHEGEIPFPYKDSKGLWTIGVGHLIGNGQTLPPEYAAYANNGAANDKNNNRTPAMTPAQMNTLFTEDYNSHRDAAAKNTKNFDIMSAEAKAAFVDLAFNMGGNWIKAKGFNSLDKSLENKDSKGIVASLTNSDWFKQVGKRASTVTSLAGTAFARDGGVFDGPNSGYPATLHGKEAVIPLKNGSVPVTISSTGLMDQMPRMDMDSELSDKISQSFAKGMSPEFKNLVDSLSTMVQQQQNTNSTAIQEQMVALLEDMRRSMQTTATASERMAAVASN